MQLILANRAMLEAYQKEINELAEIEKKRRKSFNKWTGEKREKMFENVLKFPEGTAHLDYFEKNPHPDRIGDKELALYDLFHNNATNGVDPGVRLDFEGIKRFLDQNLSDFERELLRLPEVLQNEINNGGDKDYLTLLIHLRDCFCRYFSTPTDKTILPGIQWIDGSFIKDYYFAQNAIADLRNNLFNTKAKNNLVDKFKDAKAFNGQDVDFYMWNTNPYNWDDMSFQSRAIKWESFPFIWLFVKGLYTKLLSNFNIDKLTMPSDTVPTQYGALGNFTINALPEGKIIYKGHNQYDICINKVRVSIK